MKGPFPLNLIQMTLVLNPKMGGVFLLHNEKKEVIFSGLSLEDLASELKKWISKATYFSFEYVVSSREGYLKECKYFHRFKDSPNFIRKDHPTPPAGVEIKCPECGL